MASPILGNSGISKQTATKVASAPTITKRIIVHPERQRLTEERARKIAELFKIIKGE